MDVFEMLIFSFLLIRLGVVALNWIYNPNIKQQIPEKQPLVSILIPARNEAHNLPKLFYQLQKLHYPKLEFLVLDDQSEDETESILHNLAKKDDRIRHLKGTALPQDWLGKNWACHQLAQHAQGDYLLFLDADVAYLHDEVILSALAEIQRRNLALLSIFPDQIMESKGEKSIVPLMHYLLLSLLPLEFIFRIPISILAAANGQFMFFEASSYSNHQWHQLVQSQIVEDIAIMRLVKASGKKGMAFLANGMIKTRMYSGYREAIQGFSKNILSGFGNKTTYLLFFLSLVFGVMGLLDVSPTLWISGLGIIVLMRVGSSFLANQSPFMNLLYHPWQIINLLIISILSIYRKFSGNNQWKGRNVQLKSR